MRLQTPLAVAYLRTHYKPDHSNPDGYGSVLYPGCMYTCAWLALYSSSAYA